MHDVSPDPRARGAWIAPLLATLVTLPIAFFLTTGAMLAPMGCDPCNGADSARFSESFTVAFRVYLVGLLIPAAMLVTSWALPRRRRHTRARITLAALTPCALVLLYLLFMVMLDYPR
ncbi:hypothetical protein [Streptomyces sp. URMC 123]|uniref:hypothetical protein n=1 Tax=Streptomyces sp. URMC 123 TaxID=3423403 RepID=UPI003F1A3AF5